VVLGNLDIHRQKLETQSLSLMVYKNHHRMDPRKGREKGDWERGTGKDSRRLNIIKVHCTYLEKCHNETPHFKINICQPK
jgi:hypothetical protein